MIKKKLFIW